MGRFIQRYSAVLGPLLFCQLTCLLPEVEAMGYVESTCPYSGSMTISGTDVAVNGLNYFDPLTNETKCFYLIQSRALRVWQPSVDLDASRACSDLLSSNNPGACPSSEPTRLLKPLNTQLFLDTYNAQGPNYYGVDLNGENLFVDARWHASSGQWRNEVDGSPVQLPGRPLSASTIEAWTQRTTNSQNNAGMRLFFTSSSTAGLYATNVNWQKRWFICESCGVLTEVIESTSVKPPTTTTITVAQETTGLSCPEVCDVCVMP